MKKIIIFVLAILFCFYPTVLFAETSESATREVRSSAFWHLAALPVYFFLELNLHEGSHALAGIFTGATVTDYSPFPHIIERVDSERGNFVIGSTTFVWDSEPGNGIRAYTFIAPYISGALVFITSDLLLSFVPQIRESVIFGPMVYLAGMVMPWFDFVFNLNSSEDVSDFATVADLLNVRRAGFSIIGNFFAAIGLWRLIAQGIEVFSEVRERRDESHESAIRFAVTPVFGEFNGISVGLAM